MGPLRISGTTSRLDCSKQLRRYVAQLGHTVVVVKPGGGMNMWKKGHCCQADSFQSSGEFPCAVCRTGVGSNSIFCSGCKHWVHKKCSGLKHLKKDPDYRCSRCQGTARPLYGRPQKEVQVGPDKLEW